MQMAVLMAVTISVSALMAATDREESRVPVQVSCQILFTFTIAYATTRSHQPINQCNQPY